MCVAHIVVPVEENENRNYFIIRFTIRIMSPEIKSSVIELSVIWSIRSRLLKESEELISLKIFSSAVSGFSMNILKDAQRIYISG